MHLRGPSCVPWGGLRDQGEGSREYGEGAAQLGRKGTGKGIEGCGWGRGGGGERESEGAGGVEHASTQLMAGQPWAWVTVPTSTDKERTHHQARGPPRALDAFQADVSRGALWEAEEGLPVSRWLDRY